MRKTRFAKQPGLEMEEKFSFHAAEEVIDVWTTIWADRSQMTVSLLKMVVFLKKVGQWVNDKSYNN